MVDRRSLTLAYIPTDHSKAAFADPIGAADFEAQRQRIRDGVGRAIQNYQAEQFPRIGGFQKRAQERYA